MTDERFTIVVQDDRAISAYGVYRTFDAALDAYDAYRQHMAEHGDYTRKPTIVPINAARAWKEDAE